MNPEFKNIIITGAAGAIGSEIARKISDMDSYNLILTCRTDESRKNLTEYFSSYNRMKNMRIETVDLSLERNIHEFSRRIDFPVHVLINNAAATPRERETTSDGLEMQFAANIMNYFWMSLAFHSHLKSADEARIINVASYWAGDLELSDLQFIKRKYNNNTAYRQSKQANRMLSTYFAQIYASDKISVNACHPGEVASNLSYSLGFGGSESPEKGAMTPVWLATDAAGIKKTGKWFEYKEEHPCRFSENKEQLKELFEKCLDCTRELQKFL